MIDLYSTLDWSVLCAEVAKLRIERVERGKVIALPLAKAVGDSCPQDTAEDQVLATPFATPDDDPPKIAVGDGFRRRDSLSTVRSPRSGRSTVETEDRALVCGFHPQTEVPAQGFEPR